MARSPTGHFTFISDMGRRSVRLVLLGLKRLFVRNIGNQVIDIAVQDFT